MKFASLRKECYEANMELPKLGLVIYTFSNVSCIDRKKGVFAIKPSGVDYDKLTPEDIVIVGLDGKIADGKLRPSSDTNTCSTPCWFRRCSWPRHRTCSCRRQ